MGGDARQTASGDAGATRKDRGFMPGKVAKIGTFSDWVGLFDEWRKEIGVNRDEIAEFKFDTLYGAIETEEIQFGHFKSRRKWENLRQIPTQQMRDALLNMIHAARGGVSHGHWQRRTSSYRRSRRSSRLADSEISQQVDFLFLRFIRH